MCKNLKIGLGVGMLVGVIGFSALVLSFKQEKVLGATTGVVTSSDFIYHSVDVVGTHVGTSTVGVASSANTTTYISKIGFNKNLAIYTIKAVSVQSTTLNSANFSFEGSNDFNCETTEPANMVTSSVTVDKINWFSVGDHLKGKVHATSFSNASSTSVISWTNAEAGLGQEVVLTDLNFDCLRLGVSGVSTTLYVGLSSK